MNEECCLAMIPHNTNIYHVIVHSQELEEARVKKNSRDANMAR